VARVFDRAGHVNRETGAVESFVYDAAGNLTREWTAGAAYRTNTWDAANRLTKIDPASGDDAVLTYDPLGRIATRTVGTAATTTYRYAGTSDIVVREAAGSATSYLATPAGARMGTSDGTTAHWLLYDLLGSVVASQAAGSGTTSLVDALRYDAYGQTLGQHQATGSDLGPRFRGLLDLAPTADRDVSGPGSDPLYQMGARAYAPHLGTFTKLDTYAGRAQDPISLNRYLYAHANPGTLIDPSGHSAQAKHDGHASKNKATGEPNKSTREPTYACGQNGVTANCGTNNGTNPTSSGGHPSAGGSVPPATPPTFVPFSNVMAGAPGGLPGGGPSQICHPRNPYAAAAGCWASSGPGDDDIIAGIAAGLWDGTIGGLIGMVGHVGTNLDKIPVGLQVLLADPGASMQALGEASGFDDPINNLGAGWNAMLGMSNREKAQFWTAIFAGAVAGKKLPGMSAAPDGVPIGAVPDGVPSRGPAPGIACSFAGATMVTTARGKVPISEIEPGDEVLATVEATGETGLYPVTAVWSHDDDVTGTVEVDGEVVEVTPDHPFMTVDRGWVEAAALVPGDHITSVTGQPGVVGGLRWDGGGAEMWNITVDTAHTYTVGDGEWLVHNDCGPFGPAGELTPDAVSNSRAAGSQGSFWDESVRETLVSDGSNLLDWQKRATTPFETPSGPAQVHFYLNQATGDINYYGYKSVFNSKVGQPWEIPPDLLTLLRGIGEG
jgi:RHS repeat-associated protein